MCAGTWMYVYMYVSIMPHVAVNHFYFSIEMKEETSVSPETGTKLWDLLYRHTYLYLYMSTLSALRLMGKQMLSYLVSQGSY